MSSAAPDPHSGWLNQVGLDFVLTPVAQVIAIVLVQLADPGTNIARVGAGDLAEPTGMKAEQVHEALKQLVDRGHLRSLSRRGFTIQVFRTTNARVPRVSNLGQTLNALEELLSMNNHSMDDGSPSEAHAWITLVNELANIFRKHGTEPKAAKNKRDGYAKLSRFCQFVKAVLSAVPEELREHTQSDGTLAKHISDALIRPKDPVNTRPTERGVLASLRSAPPDGLRVGEIMTAAGIKTRAAADKLVRRMAAAGKIEQRGRGKYALPGVPPDTQTQR